MPCVQPVAPAPHSRASATGAMAARMHRTARKQQRQHDLLHRPVVPWQGPETRRSTQTPNPAPTRTLGALHRPQPTKSDSLRQRQKRCLTVRLQRIPTGAHTGVIYDFCLGRGPISDRLLSCTSAGNDQRGVTVRRRELARQQLAGNTARPATSTASPWPTGTDHVAAHRRLPVLPCFWICCVRRGIHPSACNEMWFVASKATERLARFRDCPDRSRPHPSRVTAAAADPIAPAPSVCHDRRRGQASVGVRCFARSCQASTGLADCAV